MPHSLAQRTKTTEPIKIGKFTLNQVGLDVTGTPTWDEWQGVGDFIKRTHKAAGFWLADWLRYGDSRQDWQDRIDQAVDAGSLSEKTLMNIRAVGAIDKSRRRETVDFSQHVEVAPLTPSEQDHWLEQCEENGWSVRELRLNMRASKRRRVLEGQASLEGMYRVIYADPPWLYNDSGPTADGSLGKVERHYTGMTIEQLCKLPVAAHALPNAVLFMWVTAPFLLLNPGPRDVIEAWGFDYKANFVWDKVLGMPGHYNHVVHEHLIIATRGDGQPDNPTPQPKSLFVERRTDQHSRKPSAVRTMITRMYKLGPYLELFATERTPGWDAFGNDARLWHIEKGQQP